MKKNDVANILAGGVIGGLCGWAIMDIASRVKEHSFMKKKVKEDWNRISKVTKAHYVMLWCLYDGDIDKMAYHLHKEFLKIAIDDYLNGEHIKFDTDSVVNRSTVFKYLKCMKPYIKKEVKVTFKE